MMLTENLLKDEALVESIIQQCESGYCISESMNLQLSANDVKAFLLTAKNQGREVARSNFPNRKADLLESIVLVMGRPAILIQNNTFKASSDEWGRQLEAARANLEKVIPSVGRIEMTNHPRGLLYGGSGWLVKPDVIITNTHVANEFSLRSGSRFTFRTDISSSKKIGASVDFREEYKVDKEEQFEVLDVIYLDEDEIPDIAFLKISSNTLRQGVIAGLQGNPIPLASTPVSIGMKVAVIGYPAEDSARNPLPDHEMDKIFGDIYNVKRLQPGQIKLVRPDLLTHDCSTLGGNSGSVVIDLATGEAVGLHFGGVFRKENYAIPSQVIQSLMGKLGL